MTSVIFGSILSSSQAAEKELVSLRVDEGWIRPLILGNSILKYQLIFGSKTEASLALVKNLLELAFGDAV